VGELFHAPNRTSANTTFAASSISGPEVDGAMSDKNVESAARSFLSDAAKYEQPFRNLADYLLKLQSDGWTQSELRDVQALVLRSLASDGERGSEQSP
jgi:hypothetical protein